MVDHLHGHIAACWLEPVGLDPPFVSLVASGGHTRLDLVTDLRAPRTLGQTIDDAAGEAIDKGARLLGLGYPGGPALERLAATGSRTAHEFPVGLRGAGTRDFSFAGVKTALLYAVRERPAPPDERERADLAASYQEAVLRPLADRLVAAAVDEGVPAVALGGGVAANGRLRELVGEGADRHGLRLAVPDRSLCTDNAAMIGAAAQFTEAVPWPRLPRPRRGRDRAPRGDRRMRPVRRAAVALAGLAALTAPATLGAQTTAPADLAPAPAPGPSPRTCAPRRSTPPPPGATPWAPRGRPRCRRRGTRPP